MCVVCVSLIPPLKVCDPWDRIASIKQMLRSSTNSAQSIPWEPILDSLTSMSIHPMGGRGTSLTSVFKSGPSILYVLLSQYCFPSLLIFTQVAGHGDTRPASEQLPLFRFPKAQATPTCICVHTQCWNSSKRANAFHDASWHASPSIRHVSWSLCTPFSFFLYAQSYGCFIVRSRRLWTPFFCYYSASYAKCSS